MEQMFALVLGLVLLAAGCLMQWSVLMGAGVMLGAFVVRATVINFPPLEYNGVNLYPEDLVFFIAAVAAIPRLILVRRPSLMQLAWVAFTVLVIAGFVFGTWDNGIKASGVESRPFFYFSSCALYFLGFSFPRARIVKLARLWNAAAVWLLALACYRWLAYFSDGVWVPDSWANAPQATTLRVLAANEALFLWMAFLLNLYLRTSSPSAKLRYYMSWTFPFAVILLQHRSVWAAVLVSSILLMAQQGFLSRKATLISCGAVVTVVLVLLVSSGGFSATLKASLDHSVREPLDPATSTLTWRMEGWKQLLTVGYLDNPAEVVFGRHFGRGLLRYIQGQATNVSAHNYYVDILLQLGAVGLGLLLFCYAGSILRLRRLQVNGLVSVNFVALLRVTLASYLVYFLAYGASYEQGIMLGTAIGLTSFSRRNVGNKRPRVAVLAGPHLAPRYAAYGP